MPGSSRIGDRTRGGEPQRRREPAAATRAPRGNTPADRKKRTEFLKKNWRKLKRGQWGRGGWRPGGGRKPGTTTTPHRRRKPVSPSVPLHVTLRVLDSMPNLRTLRRVNVIRDAIRLGHKHGFCVIEYLVRPDRVELIVEASDRRRLSRGMQGLKVRIARRLNGLLGREGTVFRERYDYDGLETPRQARDALLAVVGGWQAPSGGSGKPGHVDPFSSAPYFDGWSRKVTFDAALAGDDVTQPAGTDVLRRAWRELGLLDPDRRGEAAAK